MVLLYWLLPHRCRWIALLCASYLFYMCWNAWLVFLIAGTTAVSYVTGLCIPRAKTKRGKKALLITALVVCLGVLAFFKYFEFLFNSTVDFLNLFSLNLSHSELNLLLPIGISFYTFQTLSYVIDVYRGNIPPEKHFGYYALFVSFFPQLVAGPIERPQNLIPQFKLERKCTSDDIKIGLRFLISGFFRKCVIADFCGLFVNSVFSDLSAANSLSLFLAIALFFVQIYSDFCGYSEIATGAARLMGIKLMRNFDKPLLATSVRDLMRRWHISLNSWFRDYLYIPLGGSRKGRARKIINTLIVFTLSGLWHGANWTFVLWGFTLGALIIMEDLLRKPYRAVCAKLGIDNSSKIVINLRRVCVFFVSFFALAFFRADSIYQIGEMFSVMFGSFGFGAAYFQAAFASLGMTVLDLIQLLVTIVCMAFIGRLTDGCWYEDYGKSPINETQLLYDSRLLGSPPIVTGRNAGTQALKGDALLRSKSAYAARWATVLFGILAIGLAWLILISNSDVSSFIYFQF